MPLPLACDLINQSEAADPLRGSAMTFVLCRESPTSYFGYVMFASGPDLCTLSMLLLMCALDALSLHVVDLLFHSCWWHQS